MEDVLRAILTASLLLLILSSARALTSFMTIRRGFDDLNLIMVGLQNRAENFATEMGKEIVEIKKQFTEIKISLFLLGFCIGALDFSIAALVFVGGIIVIAFVISWWITRYLGKLVNRLVEEHSKHETTKKPDETKLDDKKNESTG